MSKRKIAAPLPSAAQWTDYGEMELLPVAVMKRAHLEKLQLCEKLEEIADTLPAHIDRLKCLWVANALVPLLRSAHSYEEAVVFPAYESVSGQAEKSVSTERLRIEHAEDECFADEVTEILLAIGHGEAVENPEAFGFMLRGLFETLRRHIAFESEHVLPTIGLSD